MPVSSNQEQAEAAEIRPPTEWTSQTAEDFSRRVAQKYGIDETQFVDTLKCESMGFKDPYIQSQAVFHGKQEPSFGYAQFFIPSSMKDEHGNQITKDIALDPAKAIPAAAYNFKIGLQSQWTCWRDKYST